ncbi:MULTISPECIES: hypothetical protein [Burkholderia]|nr:MULTISPECIES: hypothetical protein [Burkholderia]AOJ27687.1 hypothetical protein WJ12_22385 [Burkholderia seminalis]KVF45703.1 hypothetical protein WJ13_25895 [Burkholderia seminalis]MCA8039565.1 hypothetical protein [Burkholderia seminalis]MCA8423106.1 hypothetical protein [Burkholderia seminalis]
MENKMAIPQKLAIAIATLGMVSAAAIAGTPAASDSAAHDAHHPNKATAKAPSKSKRDADDQMQAMRVMHEKMMNAKTPEERAALMDEQMKVMQNGMSMMEMMGPPSSGMPMSSRRGSMEMRMDMMQMMMQAMMDRQAAREHPAEK